MPSKSKLTLEEAADHLGLTPAELMESRGRGLEPGRLGYKDKGVLVWNRKDLPKAAEGAEEADED